MSVSLLNFDNVTFGGNLANMNVLYTSMSAGYVPSKHAQTRFERGLGMRTMDVIYKALRAYKGTSTTERFVGSIANGYVSEVKVSDTTQVTVLKETNGKLNILSSYIDENNIITGINNLDSENKLGVMLALMPVILSDSEAKDIYDKMSPFLEWDESAEDWLFNNHVDDFGKLLNQFSTNIESRIIYGAQCGNAAINISTDYVKMLKTTDLKNEIVQAFVGTPRKFIAPKVSSEPIVPETTTGSFENSFAYNPDRTFTDDEKELIAKLPSKYVMPDFVPEICEFFKESSNFPAPMRVAYLLGPAGTGKTEAANAIAAGPGLPIDHYTCNPATEIFDFIGQVFPNTGSDVKSYEDVRKELNLPSTEDIVNDPEGAYEKLYGKRPNGFPDEGKLILEMMERVMNYMATSGSGKSFTYVESGLIKAARLGYAFEIQEIGTVLRPGVAVGLNALLETGGNAFITLPTGEVIKKHKDATFIFTSNDEYEGTCNLNQSVLDRMSMVYRIDNPPKEAMKNRIMARLNFPEVDILDRMIDVIYAVAEASKERGITDGVCGYRSLENWCMATMIKSKKQGFITDALVYQTAIQCVMNKASQKQEYVDELMSSLTTQFAAPNNI